MKNLLAPEVMLFVSGLSIGIWSMLALFGIATNQPDLAVLPLLFCVPASFTALNAWKETRHYRTFYISSEKKEDIATEEAPTQVDEDTMRKPCPPHKLKYENGQMLCVKCNNSPRVA